MTDTSAPQAPTTPAPGWYRDKEAQLRWWDGTQWGQLAPERPTVTLKSAGIAYLLLAVSLLMLCGLQHFYLGKIGRGIGYLLTFGWFGVGTIIDLFTLPAQTRQVNAQRAVGIR